jgi:hypothetical protein
MNSFVFLWIIAFKIFTWPALISFWVSIQVPFFTESLTTTSPLSHHLSLPDFVVFLTG